MKYNKFLTILKKEKELEELKHYYAIKELNLIAKDVETLDDISFFVKFKLMIRKIFKKKKEINENLHKNITSKFKNEQIKKKDFVITIILMKHIQYNYTVTDVDSLDTSYLVYDVFCSLSNNNKTTNELLKKRFLTFDEADQYYNDIKEKIKVTDLNDFLNTIINNLTEEIKNIKINNINNL